MLFLKIKNQLVERLQEFVSYDNALQKLKLKFLLKIFDTKIKNTAHKINEKKKKINNNQMYETII